jgi:hypothetical protein
MHQSKADAKGCQSRARGECAQAFGDEIHSNVWGPARIESLGGRKYYVSFTDDAIRWTTIFLLRQKSDTFDAYKSFTAWVKTQFSIDIKCLHCDRAGEYLSMEFLAFLDKNGTNLKVTVHDTPEQNVVVECLNRTLMEKVRALLIASSLPLYLWGEALMHVTWLKNRTSMRTVVGKTSFEALNCAIPDLTNLPEWGCSVWIHNQKTGKIAVRAKPARWVGFDLNSDGHRIYWPEKRTVSVERSVKFSSSGLPTVIIENVELEGEGLAEPENGPENGPDERSEQEGEQELPPKIVHAPPAPLASRNCLAIPKTFLKVKV